MFKGLALLASLASTSLGILVVVGIGYVIYDACIKESGRPYVDYHSRFSDTSEPAGENCRPNSPWVVCSAH